MRGLFAQAAIPPTAAGRRLRIARRIAVAKPTSLTAVGPGLGRYPFRIAVQAVSSSAVWTPLRKGESARGVHRNFWRFLSSPPALSSSW